MRRLFALLLLLLAVASSVTAQDQNPSAKWEPHIQKFEEQDRAEPPAEGGIVFVGSSSIRLWDTAKWFPDRGVLNRGFGGSQITDANYFVDRIVLKYRPKLIVFYSGDNDIGGGKSAERVIADFRAFLTRVEQQLPETHVVYIPIKPSLKRWELWPVMREANAGIRQLLYTRHQWHYADIATPMLGEDGRPRLELFAKDGLHLNDQGYEVWTAVVRPLVAKVMDAPPLQLARGVVFHDANGNRRCDDGEPRLTGISVSNGRDVVTTGEDGGYSLPVDDDDTLFVVKPRGWRTPLSDEKLPQFYYTHKPQGSPPSRFPGVSPTGSLPASVDFPLYPQKEPDAFQAILFGDPQPRDKKEIEYVAHDVVEELIGTQASFGVTLGDIMFDDLSLFELQNRVIALLGIPWYNVIGNHDVNKEALDDKHSDESFERVFGPSYYSFDYGPVHFLVLDDIEWFVPDAAGDQKSDQPKGTFRGGLGAEQMEFIRNDLGRIPDQQLIVLMMHVPLVDVRDRHDLFRLIERRPFTLSISGHTHHHEHRFIKREDGWLGPEPHHHIINVTVSGSWWSGAPDERGIPHTMMADGAPNGYSIISFDGTRYRLDFKAAGRPADYQMAIYAPDELVPSDPPKDVYVNVFNGSERSEVEVRWEGTESWTGLARTNEIDPHYAEIVAADKSLANKAYRDLPKPKISPHLWKGPLPAAPGAGVHMLHVRTTDMDGRVYQAGRVIRVLSN